MQQIPLHIIYISKFEYLVLLLCICLFMGYANWKIKPIIAFAEFQFQYMLR